jgi:hypothetical protein
MVPSKPLITEEIWPGRGLNPSRPNDTRRSIHYSMSLCSQVQRSVYHKLCTRLGNVIPRHAVLYPGIKFHNFYVNKEVLFQPGKLVSLTKCLTYKIIETRSGTIYVHVPSTFWRRPRHFLRLASVEKILDFLQLQCGHKFAFKPFRMK